MGYNTVSKLHHSNWLEFAGLSLIKGRGLGNFPGYYEFEPWLLWNISHWKVKNTSFWPPATFLLSLSTSKISDNSDLSFFKALSDIKTWPQLFRG